MARITLAYIISNTLDLILTFYLLGMLLVTARMIQVKRLVQVVPDPFQFWSCKVRPEVNIADYLFQRKLLVFCL